MDVKSGVKAATLNVSSKNYDLPLYEGTTGPKVIDISRLYDEASVYLRSSLHLDCKLRVEDHLHRRR